MDSGRLLIMLHLNSLRLGGVRRHCAAFCSGAYMSACFCSEKQLYLDPTLSKRVYLVNSNALLSKWRSNEIFNRDTAL